MTKKRKNIEYWELALERLPLSYRKWFEKEKVYISKFIKKDSKVLDVGCGGGRNLKDILGITKNLVGIDHDKTAIQSAKTNFKEYPQVKILLAEATDLPFEKNSFDFIFCMGTFTNLAKDKYKVLAEMKRVLKENGQIFISCYSEDALSERLKLYEKIYSLTKKSGIIEVKKNGTIIFEKSMGDNISEQFSRKQLIEIFKKANLKVLEIKKFGIGYVCRLSK